MAATVDGIAARVAIDTGATGALALRREFVERYALNTRYPSEPRIKAVGADGPYETVLTRFNQFDIAGSEIQRPAVRFPSMGGGSVPFSDVDGSIGYEIVRQFVVTFDYPHHQIWFERSSVFSLKTGQGRTGLQAIKQSDGFLVVTVLPNTTAAAAGIMVGDLIGEAAGLPVVSLSQAEFSEVTKDRPDGTAVQLNFVRDGTAHSVILILKEVHFLLPSIQRCCWALTLARGSDRTAKNANTMPVTKLTSHRSIMIGWLAALPIKWAIWPVAAHLLCGT